MKKICMFSIFICLINIYCKAQFVDIPSPGFRTFLINKYPGCFNGSGQMDTTCTAITNEDSLEFHSLTMTLDGIQYFDNLKYLDCSNNSIDIVGLENFQYALPASLLYLNCSSAVPALVSFPLPDGLLHFDYSNNLSLHFFFSPNLTYLNCSGNSISNIFNYPPDLDTLICSNQSDETVGQHTVLANLPAFPATLRYLDCSENRFTALPAFPDGLTWLDCSWQYFHSTTTFYNVPTLPILPALPASLKYLNCSSNQLTSIPTLPQSLVYFNCSGNRFTFSPYNFPGITNLPALPAGLSDLNVSTNNITELPALPAGLLYLNVAYNPMMSCLPILPLSMSGQSPYNVELYNLYTGFTNINCLPNEVPGIRESPLRPVCTLTNNSNGCIPTPIISGDIFYDNNGNGIRDASEEPRANVRVDLNNGQFGFSDINGHYSIVTPDTGNYTLTIDPPLFYDAVPAFFNYSFNSYDTSVTGLVALQPNTLADSMKITITPGNTARPGQPLSYYVNYENVGTTTVNPNIVVNYDNSRLTYTNSSNAAVTDNGNMLNLSLLSITPGQTGEFTANFLVNNSAVINDTIIAKATVSAGTSTGIDSTFSVILASFDPNYKQATPSLSISQVNNGDYLNYLIGFQNTGTDTAFNIILTDTLTGMLQENTLDIIEASHPCTISQTGNKIGFAFLNINLPPMSINETASHGYIRFRIKAQPSLTAGMHVPNQAFIYFDYNVAVPTDIANTTIYDGSIIVPVRLSSFAARKQNETVQLYWTTEQEINSKEFIVERSLNGYKWDELTSVTAAGNSAQKINYYATDFNPAKGVNYYRLKQVDADNRFVYSEIRSLYFGKEGNIVVAPNPAKDKVTVYLPGNSTTVFINIYNHSGQLVKTISSAGEAIPVNISNFSKGIYAIKINGRNSNQVRKILIN